MVTITIHTDQKKRHALCFPRSASSVQLSTQNNDILRSLFYRILFELPAPCPLTIRFTVPGSPQWRSSVPRNKPSLGNLIRTVPSVQTQLDLIVSRVPVISSCDDIPISLTLHFCVSIVIKPSYPGSIDNLAVAIGALNDALHGMQLDHLAVHRYLYLGKRHFCFLFSASCFRLSQSVSIIFIST